jgi:hypothetical protein
MSMIKNFFRSKNLKDEFTRIINIRDSQGELIHYDELLGMNYENAHLVIEYIHSKLVIPKETLKSPVDFLNRMGKLLYKHHNKIYQGILLSGDEYVYTDSVGKKFSLKINGHNYNQIRLYFSLFLIAREKKINPNWNNILNSYYSSFPKYQDLASILRQKKIFEWDISSDRNEKKICITFESDNNSYFFKSDSVATLLKQISESLRIGPR